MVRRALGTLAPRRAAWLAALVLVAVGATGCGSSATGDRRTREALDDAIIKLSRDSFDPTSFVREAIENVPDSTEHTVREELIVAALKIPILEFSSCDRVFWNQRARDELVRIRARLTRMPYERAAPKVCSISDQLIYMPINEFGERITVTGYDLDVLPRLQLYLERTRGESNVTYALHPVTSEEFEITVGGVGLPLDATSRRLILRWQGRDLASIPIVQQGTDPCDFSRRITIGRRRFIPPKTAGDRDFWGHGPDVYGSVVIESKPTRVDVAVKLSAVETDSGLTRAEGTYRFTAYRSSAGMRIVGVVGVLADSFGYTDTDRKPDRVFRGPFGPVRKFEFVGDVKGNEAGTKTEMTVTFNPLLVQIVKTGCR
jgi:hypothetical protein